MKKRYLLAGLTGVAAGAIATKLLTRPRDVSWPESIKLIPHPEHSWFTCINGVRVHYQEAGDEDAPAIVLIHGFISSTLIWSDVFLPLAAAGFRVIAIDMPGYGYSDKPADGQYTIDWQAHTIVSLLDRLEIDTATIVGASYGGAVAATIALDYPERVERLVLVGTVSNDNILKQPMVRLACLPLIGTWRRRCTSVRDGCCENESRTCTGEPVCRLMNRSSRRAIICSRPRTSIAR